VIPYEGKRFPVGTITAGVGLDGSWGVGLNLAARSQWVLDVTSRERLADRLC
jgi:hypothetical protein